jgi:hypothetical protein
MEKMMSKTNDTSKLSRAILENRDVVADGDLDAVTGGAFDCFFEYTERTLGGPDTRPASDPNGGGSAVNIYMR